MSLIKKRKKKKNFLLKIKIKISKILQASMAPTPQLSLSLSLCSLSSLKMIRRPHLQLSVDGKNPPFTPTNQFKYKLFPPWPLVSLLSLSLLFINRQITPQTRFSAPFPIWAFVFEEFC